MNPNVALVDGKAVRKRRQALGHTLADVANAVGCTPQYVSLIERTDRTRVRRPVLVALASALDVDVDTLRQSSSNVHADLFAHAARWGVGGALTDLEHILNGHPSGDITRAEQLRRALSRYATHYGPTGSINHSLVWRADPCEPCTSRAAVLDEIRQNTAA